MVWRRRRSVFDDLFREMERFFEDIERNRWFGRRGFGWDDEFREFREYREALTDVMENEKEVIVMMEMPGVRKEDIKINVVEPNRLEVKAEHKDESRFEKEGSSYMERSYKGFYKVIDLPAEVETEGIKATYNNGVLEIRIPKSGKGKKKEIKVE